MLDQKTRAAILALHEKGHGTRSIARALRVSRGAVRDVLALGSDEVPAIVRAEKAHAFHDEILELYADCKGNLIRVYEEITKKGAALSYPALTAYCRHHGIGHAPKPPAGHYEFAPGQEMQHDTSPHPAEIGGVARSVHIASLVFAFSRMTFMQLYPNFTRFIAKLFLTDAFQYFGGVCADCMIDNTGVIVLHGTGRDMVPVPEMASFAERFNFTFRAHEKGDANRSAEVEVHFRYIQNNFLSGRRFADFNDANSQARQWCDSINAKFSTKLHAARRDLFATERPQIRPLPIWVPEVYDLHHRIVDLEGYVHVHGCHYSAPYVLIGRQLEVRETKDQIQLFHGPRLVGTHQRMVGRTGRSTLPEHRPPRGQRPDKREPGLEEREIVAAAPELERYVQVLKQRSSGRGTLALRRLLRMLRDYPRASFLEAVRAAEHFGLYNLDRLERMVLQNVHRDFFPPAPPVIDQDLSDDTDDEDLSHD